jgi:hypothetical protein
MKATIGHSLMVGAAAAGLLVPMIAVAPASGAATAHAHYTYSLVAPEISKNATCTNAYVNSINASGEILGTFYCDGASRGFLDVNGHTKRFKVPGKKSRDTEPSGLSSTGVVVLTTQRNYAGRYTSYRRSIHGHLSKLADPKAGKGGTEVESINASGEIVGLYFTGATDKHFKSFIDKGGKFRTFSLKGKGSKQVALIDITDSGDLAGYFVDAKGVKHGFLVESGKTTIINAPGAGKKKTEGTEISFLTDNGSYSGAVFFKQGNSFTHTCRGFIHTASGYHKIAVPKTWGYDTIVNGMTDSGEVVGGFYAPVGATWFSEAFSAQPAA